MLTYFRLRKLRVVLTDPSEKHLSFLKDCFTAGFSRGVKDTRNDAPLPVWVALVSRTSMRLAADHSPADAGSWLAGVINGRIAVAEDLHVLSIAREFDAQIQQAFFAALNSGQILECAEHTVTPFLRKHGGPASMLLKVGRSSAAGLVAQTATAQPEFRFRH